jgi:maltose alpha-D-glucosyltransferase/alpha-amylase
MYSPCNTTGGETAFSLFINFSSEAQNIQLKPISDNSQTIYHLLDEHQSNSDEAGVHHLHLRSYGYYWYRVGTLAYTLHRKRE